ncbi:MAG: 16S rRNA (guanine(527)-N(7))-methyltransferase RsmG [Rhodospirillaceae bacterium]|nr:16S rRNA (guanine(527)-N(7))-methyltransferase RsmG [Rhodospirillaceae bacterium]
MASYGPDDLARDENVSRETISRLAAYVDLLLTWNKKINLIAKSTEPDIWRRHILDSAQLYPLIPQDSSSLVDLGSGAGFPGLVLSIMGVPGVRLIESDARKCAFLREAARISGAKAQVINQRAEQVPPGLVDVVTARALAPLPDLLALARPFLGPKTVCLFLKGQHIEAELTEAHKMWTISTDLRPSRSDPSGSVVRVREVSHVKSV